MYIKISTAEKHLDFDIFTVTKDGCWTFPGFMEQKGGNRFWEASEDF